MFFLFFFSVESGEKDLQDLAQYHVEYNIIITWITTNQKRLQDVKDDDGKDRESIEKQRVILKVVSDNYKLFSLEMHPVLLRKIHKLTSFILDSYWIGSKLFFLEIQ